MKTVILRVATIILLLIFVISCSRLSVLAAAPDEIHYTITGATSITFDWRGDATSISYGPTTSYGETVIAGAPSPMNPISSSGPWREAKLGGLSSATTYHYSIGGSADSTFKTPPVPGSSGFTVYAEGDIGSSSSFHDMPTMQQIIAQANPAFVIAVGDLTYGNSTSQANVDQHFNDVMAWSRTIAYQPAWGNHEWDSSSDDLRNYKGRFDFANSQTDPKSPSVSCCGEDWYWFDYGNTRFIAYPEPWSGDDWAHWNSLAGPIMDDAQANPNIRFIVTYGHRAAWSTGYHHGESIMVNYMKGLHANHSKYVLNINGHSHNYERTDPVQTDGVTHITTGTGGGYLENVNSSGCLWQSCPPPSWSVKRFMRYGVTKLVFSQDGIQGQFICGAPGGGTNDINCNVGDVIDTFSIGNLSGATQAPSQPASSPTPITQNTCQNIPTNTGSIQVDLNIPTTGMYKVWSRIMAPTATENSFYLQVDNTCFLMGGGNVAQNIWTWVDYQDADLSKKVLLNLTEGPHTIKFIGSGAPVKIDDFIVTPDTNCIPSDFGQNCAGGIAPTATPTPTPIPTIVPPTPTTVPTGNSVTIAPTDDVRIRKASPTSNYKGGSSLYVDGNPIEQFLIKFTVSGTTGRRIKRAVIRLYIRNGSVKGGDFSLISNSWSESTVTWNTAPPGIGSPIVSLGPVKERTWVDVDVTNTIQVDGIYSFRAATSSTDGVTYASTEYSKYYAPRLVLTLE